ncbi:MAG: MOSC domain-containing protein [Verrucomicrobiota bacterium]
MKICHIYISPGHNFYGHFGKPPGDNETLEEESIQCVAGKGIEGDRFFDYKENYKGQITFFAYEVYEALREHLQVIDKDPSVFRRNVITQGVDLNEWIGQDFEIQGVRFQGDSECSPCAWMDQAFGPGAETFLKGRGGLRARILSDGILKVDR